MRDPLLFSILGFWNLSRIRTYKEVRAVFYQHCTNSGLHNTFITVEISLFPQEIKYFPVLKPPPSLFNRNGVLYNRCFLVPLNGRGNNFMMLPSNIYLNLKIIFYNLTGGRGTQVEKSERCLFFFKKKKQGPESLRLFLHLKRETRTESKSPVQSGGIHIYSSRQVNLFSCTTSESALSVLKKKVVTMDTKILGNMIRKGPEQVVPTDFFFFCIDAKWQSLHKLYLSLYRRQRSLRG